MAIIKKYLAEVVDIKQYIDNVYTIEFNSLSKPFNYKSGQFLHLALDEYDPSMAWPESRCFSMQSAPEDKNIRITYAINGLFTKRMSVELKIGKVVSLKLPYGELFSQEHNKTNTIFIAGGTGITPFLSLFNDTSFKEYSNPKLYLGLKNEFYNIYKNELEVALNINNSLKILFSYQNIDGNLDIESILNQNDVNSTYFISGPPTMIKNFKNYLLEKDVLLDNIKTDDWE